MRTQTPPNYLPNLTAGRGSILNPFYLPPLRQGGGGGLLLEPGGEDRKGALIDWRVITRVHSNDKMLPKVYD